MDLDVKERKLLADAHSWRWHKHKYSIAAKAMALVWIFCMTVLLAVDVWESKTFDLRDFLASAISIAVGVMLWLHVSFQDRAYGLIRKLATHRQQSTP